MSERVHPFPAAPAARRSGASRPVLVTGGAGFIGCNLVDRLACEGHDVVVFDALSRPGVERNLAWLAARHPRKVSAVTGDVRDRDGLAEAARGAAAVFHLAAQVAVTTSLVDPLDDHAINVAGTLSVLEAARRSPEPPAVVFASTNKVYGDLADVPLVLEGEAYRPTDPDLAANGVGERRPLDFHTPYGCSKGAADQYVLDYARSYGLPAAVLRMSCIYGPHQCGTEDQGWVAHFALRALAGEPITLFGDGRQVRDVLEVGDVVEAYLAAWRRIGTVRGRAFNMGGGPANAVSLVQLLGALEQRIGRPVAVLREDWRPGDQRWYVSDTRAAAEALGLEPALPWRQGLDRLVGWLEGEGAAGRETAAAGEARR